MVPGAGLVFPAGTYSHGKRPCQVFAIRRPRGANSSPQGTNRRNAATVTGCSSIQKPSTTTGCTGRSSG